MKTIKQARAEHRQWRQKAVDGLYGATCGAAKGAGFVWRATAVAAGLGPETQVPGRGDGAPWWVRPWAEPFGAGPNAQAKYTGDFHHGSNDLAASALVVAPERHQDRWQGSAYGDRSERKDHSDYAGARAAGLPIGAGKVASGRRHVRQQRLKIAGAGWLISHAEAMLQLRAVRANQDGDKYWSKIENN